MRISYWSSDVCSSDLRKIDKLGEVLDALVASGANQVNGPSFEIDQPEAVYDEARRAALEKAQQRARMYAKSLGMEVRRIVSISEGGGFQPPRPMRSEEHTSELPSLMRISYAVFCLKKTKQI